MSRKFTHLMIFFFLILMIVVAASALAKNGDISYWTKDISEMYGDEITGVTDYNPEIAVSGQTVHVLWMADSAWVSRKFFYRRSLDGGHTWEPRKMVFTDDWNDILTSQVQERLAVDGETVHIQVNGYGHGDTWFGKLTYIRSTDNGATFEEPRVIHYVDDGWHILDSRIRAKDGRVVILFRSQCNWLVDNGGLMLVSDDGGETFQLRGVYSTDTGSSWEVIDLWWQEDRVYVLYYDSYWYYGLQYGNLYLAASTDDGEHFDSQRISVPSASEAHKTYPPFDYHYVPKIAETGNIVCVVWSGEDESGTASVFVRRSADRGQTWDDAVNLTRDALPEGLSIQSGHETIAAQNSFVYVVFNTIQGKLFLTRSVDGGGAFDPIRRISKADGTRYVDGGWWPMVQVDPTDATGQTVHLLWNACTHDVSSDGGETFRGPALLSPHFSWNNLTPRNPHWTFDGEGNIYIVQEGAWSYYNSTGYGDWDVFYRRYEPDGQEESGENQALHLTYVKPDYETGQERFDNMHIPSHPDLSFAEALTVEFWFKLDSDAVMDHMRLLVKENQLSWYYSPTGYQIGLNMSDALRPNGGVKTSTGEHMVWSEHIMVPGEWTHLALTYDSTAGGDNLLLYVNGELSASAAVTGGVIGGEGILFVGATQDYEATQGTFDELRLWNRALPAEEIRENMVRPLTGSESGLVAYYPLDGTTRDMTGHGHDGVLMYKESFVPSEVHSAPLGDVNGDGGLNVLDMVAIANHIMNIVGLDAQQQALADCNGDGKVNVLDMVAIANVILHIFEKCPGNGCKPAVTPEVLELMASLESYLSPEAFEGVMALVKDYQLPTEFALAQNYPNPFNPSTTIHYTLPVQSEKSKVEGKGSLNFKPSTLNITLKVYNILGQEVVTLVDEVQEPGYYTVTWDASDVASGVYYYRLSSGDFTATRKMIVMK